MSCRECQTWIYDIKTAKPVLRRGNKQPRHPSQPTPCGQCPKGSPDREVAMTLSAKNRKTLGMFFAARRLGLSPGERDDAIVRRNFALLEQIFSVWERRQTAEEIGYMINLKG